MNINKILVCLFLLIISGCNVTVSGVSSKKEINQEDRQRIHQIAKEIIRALKAKNTKYLQNLASANSRIPFDSLIDHFQLNDSVNQISIEGEYLVKNTAESNISVVVDKTSELENYQFNFQPQAENTYIYLFSVDSKVIGNRWLFSTVFNKVGEVWELSYFNINIFSYRNLKAPEYIKLAERQLDSNALISALLNIQIANILLHPDPNFHYNIEQECNAVGSQIISKLNKTFSLPLSLTDISTHPQILSISIQGRFGNIYPLIIYRTMANDSLSVEQENQQIARKLENIFPGINKFSDSICYLVENGNRGLKLIKKSN